MPLVAYSVEGNGHLLVNPSGAHVPENTVVTVEAVPYTDESIVYVEFYEERDGGIHQFFPSPFGENIWKFRTESYDTRIFAKFTTNSPQPPDPPNPPHPTPTIFDFIPLLFTKSRDWWRY